MTNMTENNSDYSRSDHVDDDASSYREGSPTSTMADYGSGTDSMKTESSVDEMPVIELSEGAMLTVGCGKCQNAAKGETNKVHDYWLRLCMFLRKVYRIILDDEKGITDYEDEHMLLVKELFKIDPQQLYHRLEAELQEYVIELKLRQLELLHCLNTVEGPKMFAFCLIEGYQKLLFAAFKLSPLLRQLEMEHLSKFNLTWRAINEHLYHKFVYSEPSVHDQLSACITRLGSKTPNSDASVFNKKMVRQLMKFSDDMTAIGNKSKEVGDALIKYHKENMAAKQRMMEVNWELMKTQRKVLWNEFKSSGFSSVIDPRMMNFSTRSDDNVFGDINPKQATKMFKAADKSLKTIAEKVVEFKLSEGSSNAKLQFDEFLHFGGEESDNLVCECCRLFTTEESIDAVTSFKLTNSLPSNEKLNQDNATIRKMCNTHNDMAAATYKLKQPQPGDFKRSSVPESFMIPTELELAGIPPMNSTKISNSVSYRSMNSKVVQHQTQKMNCVYDKGRPLNHVKQQPQMNSSSMSPKGLTMQELQQLHQRQMKTKQLHQVIANTTKAASTSPTATSQQQPQQQSNSITQQPKPITTATKPPNATAAAAATTKELSAVSTPSPNQKSQSTQSQQQIATEQSSQPKSEQVAQQQKAVQTNNQNHFTVKQQQQQQQHTLPLQQQPPQQQQQNQSAQSNCMPACNHNKNGYITKKAVAMAKAAATLGTCNGTTVTNNPNNVNRKHSTTQTQTNPPGHSHHHKEGKAGHGVCPKHGDNGVKKVTCQDHDHSDDHSCCEDDHSASSGHHCDCCYCEVFGHGAPPSAPVSKNFQEIRDRLRVMLVKKKERTITTAAADHKDQRTPPIDNNHTPSETSESDFLTGRKFKRFNTAEFLEHKSINELLNYIEGKKDRNEKRAAKQQRRKQRQIEEEERIRKEAEEAERLRLEEIRRKEEEEKRRLQQEKRKQEQLLRQQRKNKKKEGKHNKNQNAHNSNKSSNNKYNNQTAAAPSGGKNKKNDVNNNNQTNASGPPAVTKSDNKKDVKKSQESSSTSSSNVQMNLKKQKIVAAAESATLQNQKKENLIEKGKKQQKQQQQKQSVQTTLQKQQQPQMVQKQSQSTTNPVSKTQNISKQTQNQVPKVQNQIQQKQILKQQPQQKQAQQKQQTPQKELQKQVQQVKITQQQKQSQANNKTQQLKKQQQVTASNQIPKNNHGSGGDGFKDHDEQSGAANKMVTIKRVMQPHNSEPTVTITLRGDSPNEDTVLYTLKNGQMCNAKGKNMSKKKLPNEKESGNGIINIKAQQPMPQQQPQQYNNMMYPSPTAQMMMTQQQPTKMMKNFTPTNDFGGSINSMTSRFGNMNLLGGPAGQNLNFKKPPPAVITSIPVPSELTSPAAIQINNAVTQLSANSGNNNVNINDIKLPPGITITKVDPDKIQPRKPIQVKQSPPPQPPPQMQHLHQSFLSSGSSSNVIVIDTNEKCNYFSKGDEYNNMDNAGKKKRRRRKKSQGDSTETGGNYIQPPPGLTNGFPSRFLGSSGPSSDGSSLSSNPVLNAGGSDFRTRQPQAIIQMNGNVVTIRNPLMHQSFAPMPQQQQQYEHPRPITSLSRNSEEEDSFSADDEEEMEDDNEIYEDDYDGEIEAFKVFCSQSVPAESKPKVNLNIEDIVLKKKGPVIGCS